LYGTSLTSGTDFGEARKQKNSGGVGSPKVASSHGSSIGKVKSIGTVGSSCD